jgi:signal transduction histidine kinase
MPDDATRRAQYLESLARLERGWSHEARSHLGNVSLQIDLLTEILAREFSGSAAEADRLRVPIERAHKGVLRLEECLGRYLGAASPREGQAGNLDLAALLAEIGELLGPAARERRVTWHVAAPAAVLPVAGDRQGIREALAIASIGAVLEAAPGSRIEARIERSGDSAVVRLDGTSPPVEVVIPIGAGKS